MLEREYYPVIQTFLRNHMKCVVDSVQRDGQVAPFICRGLNRLIVDVYGVRGFDSRHSRRIEGIAVEVKPKSTRTSLRDIAQARQYSTLAHRCYLAQPRTFEQATIQEASKQGVGLLKIAGTRVEVVAESAPFYPDSDTFNLFLHRSLDIVRCALCGCYRFRYRRQGKGDRIDGGIAGHWAGDHVLARNSSGGLNKKWFLCKRCEVVLGETLGIGSLQREVNKLQSRLKRLLRK